MISKSSTPKRAFCQRALQHALKAALLFCSLPGCGTNIFESFESPDPAEDATLAMERERPNDAIKILESALAKSPDNAQFLSILSAAYAQRAGVEALTLARHFLDANSTGTQTSSGSNGGSQNSLVSLFLFVPRATTDSVSDINYAVKLLNSDLGRGRWLAGDSFKFAIFQTAASVMSLKILDKNEDGKLSVTEIAALSSGTAVLSQLGSSQTILSQNSGDLVSTKTAELLARYHSNIASSEGSTDDEKLKNYLSQASQGASLSLLPKEEP